MLTLSTCALLMRSETVSYDILESIILLVQFFESHGVVFKARDGKSGGTIPKRVICRQYHRNFTKIN